MALQESRIEEAIAHYQQALTLNPPYPSAHYNLSLALLLSGDCRCGFAEIGVATAVMHLDGALGTVWVLLPFAPAWR